MPELPGLPEEVAQALLVQEDGSSREEYDIVSLTFTTSSGERVVNIIPIAIFEGNLLAAVPAGVWHKTASKRNFPKGGLKRPIKVEVLAAFTQSPEEVLPTEPVALWVGFLDPTLFPGLELGASPIADFDVLTGSGEAEKGPYGPGLMEVADQRFAFLTAYEDTAAAEAAKDKAAMDRLFSDTEPVPESPLPSRIWN